MSGKERRVSIGSFPGQIGLTRAYRHLSRQASVREKFEGTVELVRRHAALQVDVLVLSQEIEGERSARIQGGRREPLHAKQLRSVLELRAAAAEKDLHRVDSVHIEDCHIPQARLWAMLAETMT